MIPRCSLRRVVGKVKEECDTLHTAVLFKVSCEEATGLHVHTHSSKDNGEVVFMSIMNILRWPLHQAGLATDLSCNFVVRQTSS